MTPDPSTILPTGADPTAYSTASPASAYNTAYTVPNALPATSVANNPTQAPTLPLSSTDPLSGLFAQATAGMNVAQTVDDKALQEKNTAANDVFDIKKFLSGETADTITENQSLGIPQLNNDIRSKNLNIQGLQQKYLQGLTQIESGNIRSLSNNQQIAIQRQNALDTAIARADLEATQGNLLYAQEISKNAIAAKYQPYKDLLEAQKTVLENAKENLTRVDAKLNQATLDKKDYQLKIIEKKEKEETTNQDMLLKASANGVPTNIIAQANELAKKGAKPIDVAKVLGPYAGDYLKNELLKQQIKTEIVNQAKTISETTTTGNLKPLTEVQAKDFTYAQRGEQAIKTIDKLQDKITALNGSQYMTQKSLESHTLTNASASPEVKQIRQAERNFMTAILRRESGASISSSEFDTAEKQYFPQPGDDAQTLLQKKQNRDTAIASFRANVPQYDSRIVASPVETYLDVVTKSIDGVAQKTTPVDTYLNQLNSLPGTK